MQQQKFIEYGLFTSSGVMFAALVITYTDMGWALGNYYRLIRGLIILTQLLCAAVAITGGVTAIILNLRQLKSHSIVQAKALIILGVFNFVLAVAQMSA